MPKPPDRDRFEQLVDDIFRLYTDARQAQVRLAWETGRRIVEEEQGGSSRGVYGSDLLQRLSETLTRKCGTGFSLTNLRRMRKFYLLHPKQPALAVLDWGQQIELLPIRDARLRQRLGKKIHEDALTSRQARALVRAHRQSLSGEGIDSMVPLSALKTSSATVSDLVPLKRPLNLRFHTFAKPLPVEDQNPTVSVLVDCGFSIFWPQTPAQIKTLHLTDTPSYTYRAVVERVVDGDTILVKVEAGFGIVFRTRLRLRGVDCPEVSTAAGKAARDFVASRLPAGARVALKTRKSGTDLYGRYLADVFYGSDVDTTDRVAPEAFHLNRQLLDEGLAERREW